MMNLAFPRWQKKASCTEYPPEVFFGEERTTTRPTLTVIEVREAKKICQGCPVSNECLQYALDEELTYGIWGGLTVRERKRLLKKMQNG